MKLISQGSSAYRIIVSEQASPTERYAAQELQQFLGQIAGATLPIESDRQERRGQDILVGDSRHVKQLGVDLASHDLGDEGFLVKTVNDTLVIAGGRLRGTLYGVYSFLEDDLGVRWYSPKVTRIPSQQTIEIGNIERKEKPVLEWREPRCGDLEKDGDWTTRNKIYGRFPNVDEKHGGHLEWKHYVHTFNQLVPPQQYFAEHPEYFSQINGQRTMYRAQLCLSNADVLRLVTDKVRQWIQEDPQSSVVSVSQNDWYNYCQCSDCAARDAREGSPSGSMIHFVNQVAEAIEKDYPKVRISTLAYQYTRHAPKTERPRHNVIPHLCSIECCFAHPLADCERDASFVKDIRDWAKIAPKLYVWDYVTEFGHYISPWPNLYSLQPNIKFFIENSVVGLFEQGPGTYSEFAELRTWLLSKLLWNPDANVSALLDDFLGGYYGDAGPIIRQYIDMNHEKFQREHLHSHIWSPLNRGFTREWLQAAEELFDQAERAATSDDTLQRVKIARLPVTYVKIVKHYLDEDGLLDLSNQFFRLAEDEGITEIREGTPLREFSKDIWTLHTTRDRYESHRGFQE